MFFFVLKFFTSQISLSNMMEEHLNKLGTMVKELDTIGAPIPPKVMAMVLLMNLPESYKFTFLKLLESIDPKKLTWEVIAIRLLNDKLTRKEKLGSSKSISEYAFMLVQRKLESKNNRNKSKDICNSYKEVGHWASKCKKRKTNFKKRIE